MKKTLLLIICLLAIGFSFGQITGTKSIPGDYATIEAAIAALNASGVGAGGVTFNVASGHTETFSTVTAGNLNATVNSSSSNPVVFQKSGAGANPVITAPVITTATAYDGIIRIGGPDYITFDGIDLAENPANTTNKTDWGYAVLLATSTNASQNIIIRNCAISLNKTNTTCYGIYSYPRTVGGTATTPTGAAGVTINCDIDNCDISNVYMGIYWYGGSSTTTYYGTNNRFGYTTGNNITNFGGGSSAAYAIYSVYQSNIIVANSNINGGTGTTTTLYGIYLSTGTNANVNIYNNYISMQSGAASSNFYAIYNAMGGSGTNNTVNIYNNTIEGCTYPTATTGAIAGIYQSASAFIANIYGNNINGSTRAGSTTGTTYGIWLASAITTNCYKNYIYNLESTTGTSGPIYGIYLSSGTTSYIYNNFVSDLRTPSYNGTGPAIAGIYINGSTTSRLFYNTVFLDAASTGATFGTTGLYISTTPTIELRNNLIVNLSEHNGNGGYTVAHRRNSSSLTNYDAASNNNDFYANSTALFGNYIYYDGTSGLTGKDSTISDYKARVTPRDASSFAENPPFVNVSAAPYDLHLQTTLATQCESGATTVSAPDITTDNDGDPRYPNPGYPDNANPLYAATAPDVGADEFGGIPMDMIGPNITYTPFPNQCTATSMILTATITDPSGVPTSGTGLPQLYFKVNSGSYSNVQGVYIGSDQYTFTFTPTALVGDVISYYVVAQDNISPPNVSASPSGGAAGFSANPPACSTPPTTPNSYSIVPTLSGSYNIPGDFGSVEAAIAALNTYCMAAPGVVFNVAAGHTETFTGPTVGTITTLLPSASIPVTFQKSGSGDNPLITSGTGTGTADGIIKFAGSDYITFDGISVQDNPANLTSTTQMEWGYAIVKASATNGSQNITVKNCSVTLHKSNTSTVGIYAGNHLATSTTSLTITSTDGTNSDEKVFSNTIANCYTGISFNGFAATSPYTFYDQNNELGKDGANIITNYGGAGSTAYGVYAIYQNNIKIANNQIDGGDGTTTTLYGIYMSTATSSTIDIYSNTITINGGATTSSIYGISNAGGSTAAANTVRIYSNVIQNLSYPTATSGSMYHINNTGTPSILEINGNQISGSLLPGTGTLYGIYSVNATVLQKIYDNTFTSISGSGAGTTQLIRTGTATNTMIYSNTISNISRAGGTLHGIYISSGATASCYGNNILDLSSHTATSAIVYGIQGTPTTGYFYNNYISDLKAPNATGATAVNGIYLSGGTTDYLHYNTIFLNTTSSGTGFGSNGIYASTTPTIEMKNNLVVNTSTAIGTGLTVAYRRSSTTIGTFATASDYNDYYAGTPGASNLIFYDGTNARQTIEEYQTFVTPRESHSFSENPPFVNTSVAPYDLHLQTTVATRCESGGIIITTPVITTDYDAQNRYPNSPYPDNPLSPATAPDVGADEFGGIEGAPPAIQYTPLLNTPLTTDRTLIATITDGTGVPTSGPGLPVLYWKINSGSYSAVTATYVSGNDYSFTFGAGVAAFDIVSYYVVAQDIWTPPNIGAYPSLGASGFTANPPACSTPPTNPSTYNITVPLSGIVTIDNTLPTGGSNYNNFTDAINYMNFNGVATGGVTFHVIAGQTFAETPPVITETGTAAIPIVFEKYGSGANPVIQATGGAGTTDAGIAVTGGDYFTFNGIDVSATANTLEFGYLIRNSSATSGAKHNTVKNTRIVLDRTNTGSIGILQSASNTYGGGFVPTSTDGINEYNRYYNITVENAFNGVVIYNLGADMTLYDVGNEIGTVDGGITTIGASTADDIGGNGTDVYGIFGWNQKDIKVFNCEVRNLTNNNTTTARNVWGIRVSNHPGQCEFYGNRVHDLKSNYTTSTSSIIYGIRLWAMDGVAGGKTKVYNNAIYGYTHALAAASATVAAVGIELNGNDGAYDLYHNTVRMALSANVSSAALRLNNTVFTVNSANNIFENTSATDATSKRYSVYRVSGNLTSASNNIYYIPSGTNNFVGYYAADIASLELFAATISPTAPADGLEGGSCNYDPIFAGPAGYTFGGATPAALSGTFISYITTDIDGIVRSTTRPTIGACETTMSQNDKSPPVISNVSIVSSSTPTVTCEVYDNSESLNNANIRLWYRSNGSSGAFTGLDADSKPSGTMNGIYGWSTSLSALPVGIYQFYIAARDDQGAGTGIRINPIWSAVFVGFNPADPPDFAANPDASANVRNFSKTEILAGGTYNVGTGETYTSLTGTGGMFEKLNMSTITGNIILNITSDLTETGLHPLNQVSEQLKAIYTITIQPSASVERLISGNVTNAMIRFDGADNVIINGFAGRYLRFRNTNASYPTILLQNDATDNQITNCIIEGGNTGAASGVVVIGASANTTGNDDNAFYNVLFRDRSDAVGIPANLVYSSGTATHENSANTFDYCEFKNFTSSGVLITTTGNGNDWAITNSDVYYDAATPSTSAQTAIYMSPGSTLSGTNVIADNHIGGQAVNCGGSPWQNSGTGAFVGIYTSGVTLIGGNTIRNIQQTNTAPGAFCGIFMIGNFTFSSVSNTIMEVGPTSASTGITDVVGIYYEGASGVTPTCNVINNVISLGHGFTNDHTYKGIDDFAYSGNNLYLSFNSVSVGGTCNGASSTYGYIKRDAVNETHRDNIYCNTRAGGTGVHYAVGNTGTVGGTWYSDYNDLYTTSAPLANWYGTNQSNLSAWQTASSGDSHSKSANPNYTSFTDLHANASDLDGTGVTISGITTDHDGVTRSDPPDIGAYEFTFSKIWAGTTSNDWNIASNWSPAGVPTSTENISISSTLNQPVISSAGMTCKQVLVNNGAILTVGNGGQLTTTGATVLWGAECLVIQTGGSFIDNGIISGVPGHARVERTLTASEHHYISSPISTGLSGIFLDDYLRPSDPTKTDGWGNWIISVTEPLEVMRGYDVWRRTNSPVTKLFSGNLNTGNQSIVLNRTASDPWAGWHLVGNPYPSAVDLASGGITWNQFEPTAWFWNPGSGNYDVYPSAGAPFGTHSQYAPALQGFFVHIIDSYSGNSQLLFTNAARTHNTEPFLKETPVDVLVLKATSSKSEYSDKIVISFNNESTSGYEPGFDAYKLEGKTEAPQLWTRAGSIDLTIQSLPWGETVTTVPLGFKCSFGGNYGLTGSEFESFKVGTKIYIEDLKEGITHELTADPVYNFLYMKDDDPMRFLLHFHKSTIGFDEKESQGLVVYSFDDFVYVKNSENKPLQGTMTVTDLLGRPVHQSNLNGELFIKVRIPVKAGYYLVRVVTSTGTCNQKVYLH